MFFCIGFSKSPDCRGFTPEEFQKLDFSEIYLSEFIADIVGSIDVDKIQADFIKIQEKIESNLENLTRNLLIKKKNKTKRKEIEFS